MGNKVGTIMKAFTTHQWNQGLIPGLKNKLFLLSSYSAPKVFLTISVFSSPSHQGWPSLNCHFTFFDVI